MAEMTEENQRREYPDLINRIEHKARGENIKSQVTIKHDDRGRLSLWTEELRDLDGVLISRREDAYTYDKTGACQIVQRSWDKEGELVSHVVNENGKITEVIV